MSNLERLAEHVAIQLAANKLCDVSGCSAPTAFADIIAAAVAKVCHQLEDQNTHLRGLLAWADKHIERRGGVHDSDEYGVHMYAGLRAALSQTDEVNHA